MLFVIPSPKMGASYSNTLRISERRVQGRSPGSFVSRATAIYSRPATVRGCGGIIPPRGARGCDTLAKGYGAKPHCYSRAFSGVYGERATSMTKCGEYEECGRRFIAGIAAMNVWRRPVRAAGYCRASRTTAFYLYPAIVWEREGVTPSLTRLPATSCRRRGR